MKLYLAGPMRGLPEWNFPTFRDAKKRLEEQGHHVFCPATMATAQGYGEGFSCEPGTAEADSHLRHVMQNDVTSLMHSEAIALLPGWESSRGATVEVALAQFLGLKILDATTGKLMDSIDCPPMPWHCAANWKSLYERERRMGFHPEEGIVSRFVKGEIL